MSEAHMTWDEIKRSYPDQYVLLLDADVDDETLVVRGGRVAAHGRNRDQVLDAVPLPPGAGCALRFTGRRTGRHVFLHEIEIE